MQVLYYKSAKYNCYTHFKDTNQSNKDRDKSSKVACTT